MEDQLIKALAHEGRIRIYLCSATQLCEEARQRFDLWPTSAAALGRTLIAGSMMGSMLKSAQEQLTITINGGGAIGTIMVDAYHNGNVRGFVSDPHIFLQYNDTGKLAVGTAVGTQGTLSVIKDLHMKENWQGTVALQSGELGDDFAYYFTVSEQTPSAVSLGVLVDSDNSILCAGGFIIQMMPDARETDIAAAERLVSELPPISQLLREHDSLSEVLSLFFDDVTCLSTQPIAFHCPCDQATMKRALTTLSKQERMAMIEEDHGCEITCNFCNERYHFSEQELRELEDFIDANQKR